MNEATIGLVWRVLCAVCAVYLFFWRHEFVAAGLFALAAK